jgi:hypothetical protein
MRLWRRWSLPVAGPVLLAMQKVVGSSPITRFRESRVFVFGVATRVSLPRFNILECADLDEALEVASKNPGANFGILELRPIEP